MTNPFGIGDLSSLGLPGANPMQATGLLDTMELVRKAWSSFSLPPAMAPTIDPEEIERRIAELKAVEQWLVMNLTMLRGTIQALEIQRNTLAAMQAFGLAGRQATPGAMGETRASAPAPPERAPFERAPPAATAATGEMWPASALAQQQAQAQAAEAAARTSYVPPPPAGQGTMSGGPQGGSAPEGPSPAVSSGAAVPGQPAINPAAWWDMLQKQFSQVASTALANMPSAVLPGTEAGGGAGTGTRAGTGARGRSRSTTTAGARQAPDARGAKGAKAGSTARSNAGRAGSEPGARSARGRKTPS
jgi:hypothetical protein